MRLSEAPQARTKHVAREHGLCRWARTSGLFPDAWLQIVPLRAHTQVMRESFYVAAIGVGWGGLRLQRRTSDTSVRRRRPVESQR